MVTVYPLPIPEGTSWKRWLSSVCGSVIKRARIVSHKGHSVVQDAYRVGVPKWVEAVSVVGCCVEHPVTMVLQSCSPQVTYPVPSHLGR